MNFKLSKQLLGHSKDVRCVCVLNDGRVITGSRDHSIIVWDSLNNYSKVRLHAHSHFVGSLTPLSTSLLLRERIFASGGNDKVICVWERPAVPKAARGATGASANNNNNNDSEAEEVEGGQPSLTLIGHNDTISTLGSTADGLVLSGSWDKTIKIWDGGECLHTLEGHEAAVWSVISLSNGDIVSASADKTIKIWRKTDPSNPKSGYKVHKTLTNHKDCVRGLAVIPDLGFISCANDGLLMVWTGEGELVQELKDHTGTTSFVYAVVVVPGVGFASVGEDRNLRIWKDGECLQTITHPSGVWCVAMHPNGDIVTGCSDGVARVWTRAASRVADAAALQNYEDQIGAQTIQSDNVGDIKLNELPGLDALDTPGKKDGELKVVKNGKVAEAHQWSNAESKWVKIGEVVDSNANKSTSKGVLNGVEYDYIFDIDVDGGAPYKLGYSHGQNPYQVAQDFLMSHDLNQEFLDQVAQFIIKNTDQTKMTFQAPGTPQPSGDPLTGGNRYIPGTSGMNNQPMGDPLTGGNRYVPGTGNNILPPPKLGEIAPNKFIPAASYSYFDAANSDALVNKALEFNNALKSDATYKAFALDDDDKETEHFKGIIATLKDTRRFHSSTFSDAQYRIIFKMLKWPEDKLICALDIIRMMVYHPSASKTFEQFMTQNSSNINTNLIQRLFSIPASASTLGTNQQLICKIFCNMLRHESMRNLVVPQISALVDRFSVLYTPANKVFSLAYVTMLLDLSILSQYVKPRSDVIKKLISALEKVLLEETELDVTFRAVCGLGTLLITFREESVSSASQIQTNLSKLTFDPSNKDSVQLLFNLMRK